MEEQITKKEQAVKNYRDKYGSHVDVDLVLLALENQVAILKKIDNMEREIKNLIEKKLS